MKCHFRVTYLPFSLYGYGHVSYHNKRQFHCCCRELQGIVVVLVSNALVEFKSPAIIKTRLHISLQIPIESL